MALRICHHFLPPKIPQQSPYSQLNSNPTQFRPNSIQTQCNNKNNKSKNNKSMMSDAELASDLSKMNTVFVQTEEAMNKSRELLFTELCRYLDSEAQEVKQIWSELDEEDKRILVKGFVSKWGVDFHPLSARSVKQLVEEHVNQLKPPSNSSKSSSSSSSASVLQMMMGFLGGNK